MGSCCSKEPPAYDPKVVYKDQKEINIDKIKDPMMKFEKQFPYYRMHITPFSDRVFSINKPKVSEEELQKKFRSEAWRGVY